MASLNGISIKSFKKFMSEEGPMGQGNLYLGSKKIGFWSTDSHGGPDVFHIDSKYSYDKLMKEFARVMPGYGYATGEYFMDVLVHLTLLEREYKKIAKSGSGISLYMTDRYHYLQASLPDTYKNLTDEEIYEKEKEFITQNKEKMVKENEMVKHKLAICRSLEAFSVGDPIVLSNIRRDANDAI